MYGRQNSWSKTGHKGYIFDIQASDAYRNEERLGIVKVPSWLYSDPFSCSRNGGVLFPVNGTY